MDVSIIIATYNRKNLLQEAIKSLLVQDYPKDKHEIIVIDDGSTDGTDKMIHSLFSSHLRYFRRPARGGQSKARNLGIRESKGEITIFIDSDIIAPLHFIREHMSAHRRHKDTIVDGPAIFIDSLDEIGHWSKKTLAFFDFFGASFITANTSCPKRLLLSAGGFDEDFGVGFGWQDREIGLRLRRMGVRRVKNRSAFAYHFREEKGYTCQEISQKWRDRGVNAVLFYKKHPSLKNLWGIKFYYLWCAQIIPSKLIHAYTQGLREGLKRYKKL